MVDMQATLDELFRVDPNRAICYMLENFQELRADAGDATSEDEGLAHAIAESLAGCAHCGSANLVIHEAQGDMCCVDCGTCTREFDNTIKAVDYAEQVQCGADYYFAPKKSIYKRRQHFCDILNQYQDVRDVDIPEDVLLAVRGEIAARHAGKKLTIKLVRSMLKKLGWGYKQYENAQAILNKVCNYDKDTVLVIPHYTLAKMKSMFGKIEHAWTRLPDTKASRKSFLSYTYVIKQLLRILERADLADRIPTIKSKARVRSHDQAWETLCATCSFPFMPLLKTI